MSALRILIGVLAAATITQIAVVKADRTRGALRGILPSALALGVAACLTLPTASAETPKEGTCRSTSTVDFKSTLHYLRAPYALIAVYEGSGSVQGGCGPGQGAFVKEQCFGLNAEKDASTVAALTYCIDTDQDGDELVWKFVPEDLVYAASFSNDLSEIVTGSGKYDGMTGKGKTHCEYRGHMDEWTAICTNESSFKLP
jgi:hypothetical protein